MQNDYNKKYIVRIIIANGGNTFNFKGSERRFKITDQSYLKNEDEIRFESISVQIRYGTTI